MFKKLFIVAFFLNSLTQMSYAIPGNFGALFLTKCILDHETQFPARVSADDRCGEAQAWLAKGIASHREADVIQLSQLYLHQNKPHLAQALISTVSGCPRDEALCALVRGDIAYAVGDVAEARIFWSETDGISLFLARAHRARDKDRSHEWTLYLDVATKLIVDNEVGVPYWLRNLAALEHLAVGRLTWQQGRVADALTHYERALEMNPSAHHVKIGLGLIHILEGRQEKGLILLEEAARQGSWQVHQRACKELLKRNRFCPEHQRPAN